MAVFRDFCAVLKSAVFALSVVFVPVFAQPSFADDAITDYFAVKITPRLQDGYKFTFSLSAAGCYDIKWDCASLDDEECGAGQMSVYQEELPDNTEIKEYRRNDFVASFKKKTVNTIKFEKTYTNANTRYIKFRRSADCDYRGYSKTSGAIVFSGGGTESIENNYAVKGIYGSLGAVFPTHTDISLGPDVDYNIIQESVQKQPSFRSAFAGCSELEGQIPENLFSNGLRGTPSDAMFFATFAGCSKLGTENGLGMYGIPANLFKSIKGDITPSLFSSTFSGCSGLTGDIPEGLFDTFANATQPEMFFRTFKNCSSLTGIPRYLFQGFGRRVTHKTTLLQQQCGNYENFSSDSKAYAETFYGCSNIQYLYSTETGTKETINYIPRMFFGDVCINSVNSAKATAGMFVGVPNINAGSLGIAETGTNFSTANEQCEALGEASNENLVAVEGSDPTSGLPRILNGLYRVADSNEEDSFYNQSSNSTRKLMCVVKGSSTERPLEKIYLYRNCYNARNSNGIDYSHVNTKGIFSGEFVPNAYFDEENLEINSPVPDQIIETYKTNGIMYTVDINDNRLVVPECPGYEFIGYNGIRSCAADNMGNLTTNIEDTASGKAVRYYNANGNVLSSAGLRWNSLYCRNGSVYTPNPEETIPNDVQHIVQLYGVWRPQMYKITLSDNFGKDPNLQNAPNKVAGPDILYEQYLTEIYPKSSYDAQTRTVVGPALVNDTLPNVPSAHAWKFLGYWYTDQSINRRIQVIDENGTFIDDSYKDKAVSQHTNLVADWQKQTEIIFKCNNGNYTSKIGDSIVLGKTPGYNEDIVGQNTTVSAKEGNLFPSDETVISRCGYSNDFYKEHKEVFWQCAQLSDRDNVIKYLPVYDSTTGELLNSITYPTGTYTVRCTPSFRPKIYTLTLHGNNGNNAQTPDKETYTLYVKYDLKSFVIDEQQGLTFVRGYYRDYNPVNHEVNTPIYALQDNSGTGTNYIPSNPDDNKYGKFDGYYSVRDDSGKQIIAPPVNEAQADLPKISELEKYIVDGNIDLYAHFVDSSTSYGFSCAESTSAAVETGVVLNSIIPTTPGNPKYGLISKTGGFDTQNICHTDNHYYWVCKKTYNSQNQNGEKTETFCYKPNDSSIKPDDLNCESVISGDSIQTDGSIDSVECYSSVEPQIIDIYLYDNNVENAINIKESYGDKFLDTTKQFVIDNVKQPNMYEGVLQGRCATGKKFIGYYEGLGLVIASNGDIVVNASHFDENPTNMYPTCIYDNQYNVNLYCDTNNTKLIQNPTLLSFGAEINFPTNLNKTINQTSPICTEAEDYVHKGEWECTKYTLSSGNNPDTASSPNPFNYKVSDNNWTTIIPANHNQELYRIDCHPKWESNAYEIILNLGEANNAPTSEVEQGTSKLYGVHAKQLYKDIGHSINFFNTDNIEEPSWLKHRFDGYYGIIDNNETMVINPQRSRKATISEENYNSLVYDVFDNMELTAHWTRFYKITLDNEDSDDDINNNTPEDTNGLSAMYTDHTLVNANESFVSDSGLGSTVQDVEINTNTYGIPLKTGYTFSGYVGEGTCDASEKTAAGLCPMATTTASSNNVFIVFNNRAKEIMKNLSDDDTVWYATWNPNKYNIDLYQNYGDTDQKVATVSATYDDYVPTTYKENNVDKPLTIPVRKGYTFTGYWDTRDNSGNKYYGVSSNGAIESLKMWQTAGSGVLYAHWEPTNYSIKYDTASMANAVWPQDYEAPALYNIEQDNFDIQNPTKPYYVFAGWCDDTNSNCSPSFNPYTVLTDSARDITLYAKWEPITYHIEYNLGDANGSISKPATTNYIYTDLPLALNDIQWIGHTFQGWYTDQNTKTTSITNIVDNTPDNNDDNTITLYARWGDIVCENNQYFDTASNSCKGCPAAYPLSNKANLETMTMENCYSELKIEKYINDALYETLETRKYNYSSARQSGILLSDLNSEQTASPLDGYELQKWTNSTGDITYNSNSVLAAENGLNILHGYYTAKEMSYNLYCDSNVNPKITTVVKHFDETFDISDNKQLIIDSCSAYNNTYDPVKWTCIKPSDATISQDFDIDATGVKWENGYLEQVSCFATWNPAKIKIVLNYDNGDDDNTEIYQIYGEHFENAEGVEINSITAPEWKGHGFTGYCLTRQALPIPKNPDGCDALIDSNGNFVGGKLTNTTFNRSDLVNGQIDLWAHWVIAFYNIELDNGEGSEGGLGHLYIDEGSFYADQEFKNFVGNTSNSANLTAFLPTKANYSFAGYTNSSDGVLMVNKDGTLTQYGKSAIDNIINTGDLKWVAQWSAIKTIVLDPGAEDAVSGDINHLYIYADAINGNDIYKSVVFADENKVVNSLQNDNLPKRTWYTFNGFVDSGLTETVNKDGLFVNTDSFIANIRNMSEFTTTWTATWNRINCSVGNNDTVAEYFDTATNSCHQCPDGYGYSDTDTNSANGCYKKESCNPLPLTIEKCNEVHPKATSCEYIGDTTWNVYYPKTTDIDGRCQINATNCTVGYKENNGVCEPITYTVEFHGNSNTNDIQMENQLFVYDTNTNLNLNTFERNGYIFDGWCHGAETCDTIITNGAVVGPDGDVAHLSTTDGATEHLYAQWHKDTYNVKYYDGSVEITNWTGPVHPSTYQIDEEYQISTPIKDGYEFTGWCVSSEICDEQNYHKPYTIEKTFYTDLNLYAQWNQLDLNYAFYCDSDNSDLIVSGTKKTGQTISIPSVNTCENKYGTYRFTGWICDTGAAFTNTATSIVPDMTLTSINCVAQWEEPECITGLDSAEKGQYFDGATNTCIACPDAYPFAPDGATSVSQCYNIENCGTTPPECTSPAISCKFKVEDSWTILNGEPSRIPENCIIEDTNCLVGYVVDETFVIDSETGEETSLTQNKCRPIKYTVYFRPNSGVPNRTSTQSFNYGETKQLIKNPFTKQMNTFIGWCQGNMYTAECNDEDIIADMTSIGPDGDIQYLTEVDNDKVYLHAQWREFTCADDEYYDRREIACKKCPDLFPNYIEGSLTSIDDCFTTITVHNNINDETEELDVPYIAEYINGIPLSEIWPQYVEGYAFKTWQDENGVDYADQENDVLTVGMLDVYGYYEKSKLDYNVYCNDEKLDLVGYEQISYGENFNLGNYKNSLSECPDAEDKVFNGWSCVSNAYKSKIKNYSINTENISWAEDTGTVISCYANWRYNTFTVKFDANGGNGFKNDVVCEYDDYNCDIRNNKETEINRFGYRLLGWSKSADSDVISFTNKMTENPPYNETEITLYAIWEFVCESGKWLRVGNERICMYEQQTTHPAMVIHKNNVPYYIMLTKDPEIPINKDSSRKMHVEYGGDRYNAHDASVF